MDGFPIMPTEIDRLIAIEAVRLWNREISDAIIESGILDNNQKVALSCFWPRFVMHKIRRGDKLPSREYGLIRRAAQRVVAFRTGEPESANSEALQEYLWEICQFSRHAQSLSLCWPVWFTPDIQMVHPDEIAPIRDSDEDFKQTILAAAAATNDLPLVRELLPTMQDRQGLVYQTGESRHIPVLGYPIYIAAFQGHVEVLRTLLEIESDPQRLYWLHQQCVSFARAAQAQTEFLTVTFRRAAVVGNLVMMKHLVRLGASPTHVNQEDDGNMKYQALISGVAAKGHADVLAYLLENGAEITSRALEAACQHGNPDTVRVLLAHGARDTWMPGNALLEAVMGENETALRLLLGAGTIVDEDLRRRGLEVAERGV
ncbi:uncharacterized protein PG986_004086 [Apiospora aurea]|uniref:Ankyrin repeat protein n=1 Tax=Apiospora aurea TaxID=335848 RepID=A0ABR1QM20_9PEZI